MKEYWPKTDTEIQEDMSRFKTEEETLMSPRPSLDQLINMDESDALDATEGLTEHPEGYDGPCACNTCLSFDGEVFNEEDLEDDI